eukprot:TRINITY_DN844_c0_g1_i1.p1 TRINITY_DN844_c0_g1~~TRINITY_DN844_c0_g1_i1.p1  ORF type:complete len:263 (+),score=76.42 TRINITY_DN844_c0_g1_i1:115-903(+)
MSRQIELDAEFKQRKEALLDQYNSYLESHPEIRQLLHDFVSACLIEKPDNVRGFAKTYFSRFSSEAEPVLRPLVVCGPSGVGKGTLLARLMKDHSDTIGTAISHTTRAPREGEVNGVHYFFTTVEEMKAQIEEGKFIEYAQVHANMYGKSRASVEAVRDSGKICLLEMDVQGAETIKKSNLNAYFLFLQPPSMEELKRRLQGRGSETPESLERRFKNAEHEMSYLNREGFWDCVLTNDEIQFSYERLQQQLASWYPQFKPKL